MPFKMSLGSLLLKALKISGAGYVAWWQHDIDDESRRAFQANVNACRRDTAHRLHGVAGDTGTARSAVPTNTLFVCGGSLGTLLVEKPCET